MDSYKAEPIGLLNKADDKRVVPRGLAREEEPEKWLPRWDMMKMHVLHLLCTHPLKAYLSGPCLAHTSPRAALCLFRLLLFLLYSYPCNDPESTSSSRGSHLGSDTTIPNLTWPVLVSPYPRRYLLIKQRGADRRFLRRKWQGGCTTANWDLLMAGSYPTPSDQAVYGLVSKRTREEERTPADRLGQGDEEDLRGSSLEESSIREERVEADGTGSLPSVVARVPGKKEERNLTQNLN
ncbi:unnamed protein product [Nezara viridula]|uniref:Uncharacterized protein n=1 Tax=Nezara viridula TaxID=85310 RepID=A0A9P0E2J5_NEZVI|nr:unnamed protein product [Nezara viridula]